MSRSKPKRVGAPRGRQRASTPAQIAAEATALGVEAAAVVALRSARLARGGTAARAEATLMLSEKIEAAGHLTVLALSGRLGFDPGTVLLNTLRFYREGVRANRQRLARRAG